MENEKTYRFHIDKKESRRLDSFLAEELGGLSRSCVQRLIEEGRVKVNGYVFRLKKYKASEGDRIEIEVPTPKDLMIEGEDIPLDVVYEDDDVLIVNKPKGMAVHPSAGNFSGTLVNAVMFHCGSRLSHINGATRPGIVHRIDKNTSGLLMIAKNNRTHEALAAQLAEHSALRVYQALVYNNFREDGGVVNAPLGRDPKNRLKRAVNAENSKNAVTRYKVLERFGKYTFLEIKLETGRTHQIRAHMAYIKHPVVGDTVYGPKKQDLPAESQLLHAKVLGFIHPSTGRYMEFDSQLPEYFTHILDKLRKEKRG